MEKDNISKKQRSNTIKEFEAWAKESGDKDLIESLFNLPDAITFVDERNYKIAYAEISKLRRLGGQFQTIITELVKAHNEELSDTEPNNYTWEIHYKNSICKIRDEVKLIIDKSAKEVLFQVSRNGNLWENYYHKFEMFFHELCSLEKKNNGSVIIFRPFIENYITTVLIELHKISPIVNQSHQLENLYMPYFDRYDVFEFFTFNIPFEEWLNSKNVTLKDDDRIEMVDDLMEMRSIFYKNWDADKHRISINKQFDGVIDLQCAVPSLAIVHKGSGNTHRRTFDTISWCIQSGKAFFNSRFFSSYGLNADYLLQMVHDYLIELFFKVKSKNKQENTCFPDHENTIFYQHLEYIAVPDIVDEKLELDEPKLIKSLIPKVRQNRLFAWLENQLGCKILSGKGSEIKVYYPGGKIYTLGKHKPDPDVSPWKVREILKRVGIEETVWTPLLKYL